MRFTCWRACYIEGRLLRGYEQRPAWARSWTPVIGHGTYVSLPVAVYPYEVPVRRKQVDIWS